MKKSLLIFTTVNVLSASAFVASACQMHANGFGAFAAYHKNNRYEAMMSQAVTYPTVTLAKKTVVKVGSQSSQSVKITVPLSYYNVSLTVRGSDDIELLSASKLKLSAVSDNYDLAFTSTKPGTHEITVTLNAVYEGSAFSTKQTLIVETG